jgi:predicted acylesterase/phospholipase RssA
MPTDPANIRTTIVLQGRAALGAYELGVLKAIYDQRPGFKPAAVADISIGAVTAAVLGGARGQPIAALETLWRDKLTVLPQMPSFPRGGSGHREPPGQLSHDRIDGQWYRDGGLFTNTPLSPAINFLECCEPNIPVGLVGIHTVVTAA